MLPGTLEMLILKALERNLGPMHGYGIALYLKQISEDVLQVEEGSLYPALQRLAIKGWVKTEWGQSENNRRARFYKLTPAGRKQLKQEVADFERLLEAILCVMEPAGGETPGTRCYNSGAGCSITCGVIASTVSLRRK